ncbi:MAG: BlaI/MecI/CopY family transcriptional regulator [bacterium]
MKPHTNLSRRERQIMEIIYRRGKASVADVMEDLPDPPSYSAVRATLRILEEKGHLNHGKQGPRYVFSPTVPRENARRSALKQMLHTFFDGSVEQAVAAMLEFNESRLTESNLDRLAQLIEKTKKGEVPDHDDAV